MKLKILVIRFSSIGDIVLTTPVLRCLTRQINADVHFLTKKKFAAVLNFNPYISKIHTIEKNVREVLPSLKKERFSYIIDLHHNLRSLLLKAGMLSVPSRSFNKLNFEKWLMVRFKINRLPERHIVDRYLDTVGFLGVKNDGEGLDFFINPTESFVKPFPKYLAFVVGAGYSTKALTVSQSVNLLAQIKIPVVLLGGSKEVAKASLILDQFNRGDSKNQPILNRVGQCTLAQSAGYIREASVVLTGDTGLMHIAAAFKKPIISIWGNTIPEFGMYPYYPKELDLNTSFEKKDLSCRPCSKIGFNKCPQDHFNCIKSIDIRKISISLAKSI